MTETNITEEEATPDARPVDPADAPAAHKPKGATVPKAIERVTELGEKTVGEVRCENPFIVTENVDVYYGDNHAIQNVTLEIGKSEVIALIGPSGCGKSTYLRCLNRMNDSIESSRVTGKISLDGLDIYGSDLDPVALRARVGMVFQKPNPFEADIAVSIDDVFKKKIDAMGSLAPASGQVPGNQRDAEEHEHDLGDVPHRNVERCGIQPEPVG